MNTKYSKSPKSYLTPKFLLISFFLLFIIIFTITRSSSSPSPTLDKTCSKIPSSLADTILHYVTTNTTPQQTFKEISVTSRVLAKKSPCNLLVFGLGHDSLMWAALNHGGRTIFLEEDASWIEQQHAKFPSLESYHVKYNTKLTDADELMRTGRTEVCRSVHDVRTSKCGLALRDLPDVVWEHEWDLVMVDAPTGWVPEAPGRMGAIYTAGMVARGRRGEGETDVFVHDVDRSVEDLFSKEFLCEGYMKEQEGRLRHFVIPSHRGKDVAFCP